MENEAKDIHSYPRPPKWLAPAQKIQTAKAKSKATFPQKQKSIICQAARFTNALYPNSVLTPKPKLKPQAFEKARDKKTALQ